MINKNDAIISLVPDATFNVESDGKVNWVNPENPPVTDEQIETEIARLQVEFDNKQYQRDRVLQYPHISDQLDMLWHAIDTNSLNKTSDFYTTIKAVKDAYPKSE